MKRILLLVAAILTLPVAPGFAAPRPRSAVKRSPARRVGKAARPKRGGKLAKKGGRGKGKRAMYTRAVPVYTQGGMPNVQAQAALIIDLQSGAELFQKNPDEIRPIASISKLMAALVVLERKLPLDGVTEILESDRKVARRGAKSRLPVGIKLRNIDLLHAALMQSDNRAVPALGRAVGLDPEQMAAAMSKKAAELKLHNTYFGDPTGLDVRNRSTPREVVKLLQAALRVPLIAEITHKARYAVVPVDRPNWRIEFSNTDAVARNARFEVLGGKTGYNDRAGYCLTIAARLPGGREIGMAFLGAVGKLTRFGDFARTAQWIAEKNPQPAPVPTQLSKG